MSKRLLIFGAIMGAICAASVCWAQVTRPIPKIAVTTYHYDTFRTGWNPHEEILNPTLRDCSRFICRTEPFGLRARVTLDDTVYAQPLIVPDVIIAGGVNAGKHDVVYVVTENNSIYAIDANDGEILLFRNLGEAVPAPQIPRLPNCRNNGPRIGIESTPVIDLASGTMYLMSYTKGDVRPAYRLYAVDIATLNDKLQPVVVSASHRLTDGSMLAFDAALHRQRAALLLADGNVYAAFSSWCDRTTASRGWLLGWSAANLSPLVPAPNFVTDRSPTLPALSTIWMSGYGVAGVAGHLYFATGNSRENTYDSNNNRSESVVKISADLTQVLDFFTPSNVNQLDHEDRDLGSGGVLLLPDQPGSVQHMAAAAGKDGRMFLIDRNNMGRFDAAANHVLDTQQIGECYCGQSYYLNNIVSSGGRQIGVWHVNTSPTPNLTQIHSSIDLGGSGSGGFFTSISSNGDADVMIWAVSRRDNFEGGPEPTLFAFQPIPGTFELKLLFQSVAGNWDVPFLPGWPEGGNSNIVPVVANGHVYVASYRELDIFGFVPLVVKAPSAPDIQSVSGIITTLSDSQFTLKTEAGAEVRVEAEVAIRTGLSPELHVGQGVNVSGIADAQGVLHADVIKPFRTANPR